MDQEKEKVKVLRRLPMLFAALGAAVAVKAQQPVVITVGPTTFGPPKPLNGECPSCHTMNPPFRDPLAGTYDVAFRDGVWSRMVRCSFCSAVFWQDAEKS